MATFDESQKKWATNFLELVGAGHHSVLEKPGVLMAATGGATGATGATGAQAGAGGGTSGGTSGGGSGGSGGTGGTAATSGGPTGPPRAIELTPQRVLGIAGP